MQLLDPVCPTKFNDDVLALDPAEIAQARPAAPPLGSRERKGARDLGVRCGRLLLAAAPAPRPATPPRRRAA
jgi:hypothetical protein